MQQVFSCLNTLATILCKDVLFAMKANDKGNGSYDLAAQEEQTGFASFNDVDVFFLD
jgi:hypothetical protein